MRMRSATQAYWCRRTQSFNRPPPSASLSHDGSTRHPIHPDLTYLLLEGKTFLLTNCSGCIERHRVRLRFQLRRKLLVELDHFRPDNGCTVALEGIPRKILLVIGLGFVPGPGRSDFRHDRIDIELLFCHGCDHLLGNLLLLRCMVENCRAVLCAGIMTLPVERRRIVDDKQHFKQLAIAADNGIERDTDRFCVTSPAATHSFIRRMIYLTTNIAGLDRYHTLHLVIDRFEAPKAAAGYSCNTKSSLRWKCGLSHRADL